MSYEVRAIKSEEFEYYCSREEDHFFDRKSSEIKASKLSQSFSSLANADGGEIFVGLDNDGNWAGYGSIESANDVLQVAANLLQHRYYTVEFVKEASASVFGVIFTIERHPTLVVSSSGEVYQRNGAQNRRLIGEELEALKRSKGESRYELTQTSASISELENSLTMISFMTEGDVFAEPYDFLVKNVLITEEKGNIASTLLFSDLPQAHLPAAAVKLYRYKTTGLEERSHLDGKPETIEGPITTMIELSEKRVGEIVSSIPRLDKEGFTKIEYPTETLHEILTNALLHRDYGMQDYVHVRIFDNRIEVDSPGRLHGHVTVENILDERSARNPQIQRVINKFPEAPNQDIGEGLNTAFQAMENLRLSLPVIEELSDRVRVTISHEPLASPQKAIMEAALQNGSINNSEAREVTKILQERTIRRHFQELVTSGQLEQRGSGRGTRYYPTTSAEASDL